MRWQFTVPGRIGAVLAVLGILCAAWGCYPKRVGPPGPGGKRLTWPEMDRMQRVTLMKEAVLPRAAAIFQAWRPERYAHVDCTLCHGPDVVNGDFRMPTDHLPRLSGTLLLGPEFAEHPDTTKLKLEVLVPEMSEALGLKKFSVVTRSGFGCYSCHLGPDGPRFGN